MKQLNAALLVLLGSVSYGTVSTTAKLAYQNDFSAAQLLLWQNFSGCLFFWLLLLPHLALLKKVSFSSILKLIFGGSSSAATGILYFQALQTMSASFAVVLLFQFTWIGICLEWLLQKRNPGKLRLCALVTILCGTLLASSDQTGQSSFSWTGVLFGLGAAFSYSLFLHFSGNIAPEEPPLVRSALLSSGAAWATAALYWPPFLMPPSFFIYAACNTLCGIILPFYLFARAIPHLGTGWAALLGAAELPAVLLIASIVLKEKISWPMGCGISFILLGILLSAAPLLVPKTPPAFRRKGEKTFSEKY